MEPKRLAWSWRMLSLGSAHLDSKPHFRVRCGNARQAVVQFEWDNIPKLVQKTSNMRGSMMLSGCSFYILLLYSVCTRVVVHLHTFLSIGWYIPRFAWQCSYRPICLNSQRCTVYKVISQLLPNIYHRCMGISSDYHIHIQIWLWSLRGAVRSWFLIRRWAAVRNCLRMASSLQSLPLCLRELRSLFRSSPVMKCCNLLSRCSFLPLAGLVYFLFTKWLPTQNAFQQSPDNRPELRLFVEGIVCVGGEHGGGSKRVFVFFLLFWSRQGQNHTYYNSGFVTALHSDPHELFFFGYFKCWESKK